MKVLIFFALFTIILISKSYSENMTPLKTFLKNNKNYKDKSRTVYLFEKMYFFTLFFI